MLTIVNSFYLPNVPGNGMTPDEYAAWMQWNKDMEYFTTDPEQMREIDKSRERLAKRIAARLDELRKQVGGE